MSSKLGFSSEIDFAEAVVKSSGIERWKMLKRYYVDKNPVLSGLSSFTAYERNSAVDNSTENVKRAKRSSKRTQANNSHITSKRYKLNAQKHRAKVKTLGKDMIREENRGRHEVQRQDGDNSPRRMLSSSVVSEEKQPVNLKNCSDLIESKDCLNIPVRNTGEGVVSVDFGNCRIEAKGCETNHRNQSPQEDGKCYSKESRWNRDNAANIQGLSVASTVATSVSILDEFLSNDSDGVKGKGKNANKSVDKVNSCSDKKQEDDLEKKDWKDIIKLKKKPISVLDEFI